MIWVKGCRRLPVPPARMTPFIDAGILGFWASPYIDRHDRATPRAWTGVRADTILAGWLLVVGWRPMAAGPVPGSPLALERPGLGPGPGGAWGVGAPRPSFWFWAGGRAGGELCGGARPGRLRRDRDPAHHGQPDRQRLFERRRSAGVLEARPKILGERFGDTGGPDPGEATGTPEVATSSAASASDRFVSEQRIPLGSPCRRHGREWAAWAPKIRRGLFRAQP